MTILIEGVVPNEETNMEKVTNQDKKQETSNNYLAEGAGILLRFFINKYQSIFKATVQIPQQSASIVQTQPIFPSNKTIVEPTSPTNVTVPRSEQKTVGQQNVVLSFDFVYWVFLGVGIATIVVGLVVYWRKKTLPNNIKYLESIHLYCRCDITL